MTDDRRWTLKPGAVSWREADGEVIVLDLRTSDYLGVNAAGRVLWTRLAGGATATELAHSLTEEFGIAHDRAAQDVATFLDDARTRDLLV